MATASILSLAPSSAHTLPQSAAVAAASRRPTSQAAAATGRCGAIVGVRHSPGGHMQYHPLAAPLQHRRRRAERLRGVEANSSGDNGSSTATEESSPPTDASAAATTTTTTADSSSSSSSASTPKPKREPSGPPVLTIVAGFFVLAVICWAAFALVNLIASLFVK